MIPAEAVEAAAKALYFYLDEDHRGAPAPWESLAKDDDAKIDAMDAAHIALEAAAPYMLAAAFEQGQKSGMRHADRLIAAAKIGKPELPGPISPNPYMRDTEGEK